MTTNLYDIPHYFMQYNWGDNDEDPVEQETYEACKRLIEALPEPISYDIHVIETGELLIQFPISTNREIEVELGFYDHAITCNSGLYPFEKVRKNNSIEQSAKLIYHFKKFYEIYA